ncbi:hypothetical protein [Micromonospora viridifaciens]|nr:hypothetical protein [Micromonospora viridifaciens]
MLTALLDAAADGRSAGGWRSTAGLIADGLRCRLRVTGALAMLLALLASLAGAGALAAAAGWSVWQVEAASWPSVADAKRLTAPILPSRKPAEVAKSDSVTAEPTDPLDKILVPFIGTPEWEPGGVRLNYVQPADADVESQRAWIRAKLTEAGWRTSAERGIQIGEQDGIRIEVWIGGREPGTQDLQIHVYPAPPAAAYTVAGAAAVVGAFASWLLAAAGIARIRRHPPLRRAAASLLAGVGAVAIAPASLLNLLAALLGNHHASPPPPWVGYQFALARPAAAIGALLLLMAFLASFRSSQSDQAFKASKPDTAG